MSFSDDEEELLPESVSNYYFVDEKEEPVSFCVLPFRWQDDQNVDACKKQVFLHGVGDDGLQKIYKQVTEWKLELEGFRPVVFVLSKDQKWLQLSKPRKSYEDMIRKILITIHCLHYLRNNSDSSEKSLWDHLKKEFSHFEVRPSRIDLQDHLTFFREFSQRDEAFAKCQLLPGLIDGASKNKSGSEDMMDTKNSDFINDEEDDRNDDGGNVNEDEADSDEEQDCFDSVCAICDNGGELTVCEGRCLRSFHAIKGVDTGSDCKTLGYTKAQIKAIQNFLCPNCRFKMHQCFACGKLGSSDRSAGAEVFPCVSATCGHFYHPKCVAMLLNAENEKEALEQEKKIAAGEAFICPVHKCLVCKQGENKEVEELQFAVCRRCPRSYHRKCLPSQISFEDSDEDSDEESDIIVRAWDNLLPNRILIYCMRHKIDEDLGTPIRNHLKFPEDPDAPEKKRAILSSSKTRVLGKKAGDDVSEGQPAMKKPKLMRKASPDEENGSAMNASASLSRLKKSKTTIKESDILQADKSSIMKSRPKAANIREIESNKSSKSLLRDLLSSKAENASPGATAKKLITLPEVDSETQKRVIALARRSAASSLTLDMFIKQKEIPSTHAYSDRRVDKTVTLGKVEGSIEAIQAALQKVKEDNGSTDNAKAVCEPGIVVQITRWRNTLGVYLSPFLHGLLYTSFGRHFTKVDKLKEIVDRLHWYVQSGDTIVDFCCGANDFSTLMKEKLEVTGKKCSYRNFDIIPPKNDFNFVKRDWMKVRTQELPHGSQLIMGLNPPFGVKGALANKFIDKALEFRPKLIILIVPKETERLDVKKGTRYDLIWEDDQKLSGKSFYMPGNVDVNDKLLEQWNVSPPPLYLWSRPDWTSTHMEIAKRYGHIGSKPVGESAAAIDTKIPSQETTKRYGNNGNMPGGESAAAAVEIMIPSPVREGKPVQAVVPDKIESSQEPREIKADGNAHEAVDKKEPKSSQRNKIKKQKANIQEHTPGAKDAKEELDMSISPRREDTRMETSKNEKKEELPDEKTSIQTANHEDAFDKIRNIDISNERLSIIEDKYRQRTPAEVNYPLGSALASNTPVGEGIYGLRTSEERFQGYGGDSSLGLLDRSRDDLRSDIRRYGQPRTADLLSDIRTYGMPSSTYGASVSATRGYGDSVLGSSVTDKYASRLGELGPGLPSSSIGSSAIDRYAPRLDDNLTYVRRNSVTPDPTLLGRGTPYGTPGAWDGGIPPRESPAFPPGSRFPPSGWPQ